MVKMKERVLSWQYSEKLGRGKGLCVMCMKEFSEDAVLQTLSGECKVGGLQLLYKAAAGIIISLQT